MSAAVALGLVELHFGEVDSLKGKRHVLKGMKEKVKHRFNVSVAEVDQLDSWQTIVLGVAQVGNDRDHVDRCLREVSTFITSLGLAEAGREVYDFTNY